MNKSLLLVLIPLLSFVSFAETGEQITGVKVGGYVTSSKVVSGFLKYKGVHSGVTIVSLSLDVGSSMPSEDLRFYVYVNSNLSGPILSLPRRGLKGYRCAVEGDILKIFATKGLSRVDVSIVPIAIIDLKQLTSEYANQVGADQPATAPESKLESKENPKSDS